MLLIIQSKHKYIKGKYKIVSIGIYCSYHIDLPTINHLTLYKEKCFYHVLMWVFSTIFEWQSLINHPHTLKVLFKLQGHTAFILSQCMHNFSSTAIFDKLWIGLSIRQILRAFIVHQWFNALCGNKNFPLKRRWKIFKTIFYIVILRVLMFLWFIYLFLCDGNKF